MKVFKALVLAVFLAVAPVSIAVAQEITPDPGTYRYGSTSEFSPYQEVTIDTGSDSEDSESEDLADTGIAQTFIIVSGISFIIAGAFIARQKLAIKKAQ